MKNKKIENIIKLLNEDDEKILKIIFNKTKEFEIKTLPIFQEKLYEAKNKNHINNIRKVIEQLKLKQIIKQINEQLKKNDKNCLILINNILNEMLLGYETNLDDFDKFKSKIIKKSWLFLDNEKNIIKAISVLHTLLIVDIKTIDIALNYDFIKHNKEIIKKTPEIIALKNENILKNLNFSVENIIKLLQGDIKLKINNYLENDNHTFKSFFINNILHNKNIDYLLFLILIQNLLLEFNYNINIIKLKNIQLIQKKDQDKKYIGDFFLIIEEKEKNILKLYNPYLHQFIDFLWVSQNNKNSNIIKTLYNSNNIDNNSEFYNLIYLNNKNITKLFLNRLAKSEKIENQEKFKTIIENLN